MCHQNTRANSITIILINEYIDCWYNVSNKKFNLWRIFYESLFLNSFNSSILSFISICFSDQCFNNLFLKELFFFLSGFSFTDTDDSRGCWRREGTIFYSTLPLPPPITNIETFLSTLHVRWPPRIFNRNAFVYQAANRNAFVYQAATRWDLPSYQITIWLIDNAMFVCLFTWWIDSRFLLQRIWHGKPVDLNSHRLSPLYYKRGD